jgi:hypothetical protein
MYPEKYEIWSKEIETVSSSINHAHIITNSIYTIDRIRKSGYQQSVNFQKILTACLINRASS